MALVLAIEPDSAQADPLTSLVRAKLGAQLQLVASTRAAIVAINQRVPDVILLGRAVPQEQRTKVVSHLRSIVGDGQVRTVDIPHLTSPQTTETFGKQIGVCLASAEDARVRAAASVVAGSGDTEWSAVALDDTPEGFELAAAADPDPDDELRAAEVALIEAEVEFRLKSEVDRLQAEGARQQALELSRVEAEATEQRAREIARVEAEAAQQRATELERIEREAASLRESAVAEARAAAEAAGRDALATELERVRREAEQQLAEEVRRVREEADRILATKVDAAEVEAARDREIARMEA
ncbi:MAG TPA: hypothetical protein VGJ52_10730, partial [Vicinamibacterales bacterium]